MSSDDPVLTRALEERCFNAWPALRTVLVDGWVFRLSDGHTKRANSASALHPSSLPPEAVADLARTLFVQAGLRPVLRVTPLAPPDFADRLKDLGWWEDEPTHTLHLASLASRRAALRDDGVTALVEAAPSEDWIAGAMEAYAHGARGAAALRRMLPLIVPDRAFVTLIGKEGPCAWGLAVAERGMVGLYDLVVAPAARGHGHGRRLVDTLLSWGAMQGAGSAYLQVRTSNAAAISLYRSLGFERAYDYSHLFPPD